ncbi:hypothetical protein [Symbiobacterium thermophilum]|uniref:Uncharacterized protein n=2 Tax=Symbiobacterium thermophilum TaxID=2734 RepID=Q67NU5_SYMTH|nr:hypothetical protein [Symbiobacterium thermophilum]MBY6274614.1 hypothetical protein [Symbiobacterium thermophilum]BAD40648.1 conserved hypothetical protein [Symbiobacterium thermophilum IAM 14863]
MQTPLRPLGISPADLEAELAARRASHRAQVDLLKARLAEAGARNAQLRQRRAGLQAERERLEQEIQRVLEEFDRTGTEFEVRRREVAERHRRELADREAELEAVRKERDNWIALERQIAEGILAAVQPFLQLQAYLREQEGGRP